MTQIDVTPTLLTLADEVIELDAVCCTAYVAYWHESEIRHPVAHVGYWGKTGQHLLVLSFTGFEPEADVHD